MKKVIIILIIITIIATLIGMNKKLFPARKEITNLAMARVVGIDASGKQMRILTNNKQDK